MSKQNRNRPGALLSRLLAGFASFRHPMSQTDEEGARERLYPPPQNVESTPIVTPPGHRRLPQ